MIYSSVYGGIFTRIIGAFFLTYSTIMIRNVVTASGDYRVSNSIEDLILSPTFNDITLETFSGTFINAFLLSLNKTHYTGCDEINLTVWYDFDINPIETKFLQVGDAENVLYCSIEFASNAEYMDLVQRNGKKTPFEKSLETAEIRYLMTYYLDVPEEKQ